MGALTHDERALLAQVDVSHMMHIIQRLCADDFAGRKAGSPQSFQAGDYLLSEYKGYGLSPLGLPGIEGYKQVLTMRYSLVDSMDQIKARLSFPIQGVEKTKTFSYSGYNGRGGLDLRSKVVFVGYGIEDTNTGYDDYRGLDVKGKVVLWLSGRPGKVKKEVSGAQKMLTAYQHGACACLICRSSGIKDNWGTNVGLSGSIADFPYIAVDEKVTGELMGVKGSSLTGLAIGRVGAAVRLSIPPVCDPDRKTYNILAEVPGSTSEEVVMVGAHYDHLGERSPKEIFRGADDNASGTSVVLETARAIMRAGLHPKRTIIFASWTGEEAGLVGSNYFVANPPFPLSSIVSNIELDMVGEGIPGFMTTGKRAYPKHYAYLESSGKDLGLPLNADQRLGASDYLAFVRKEVPTSLLFSMGEHPYYHTSRDNPAFISPKVLESAGRLTALAIWRAAND